jgi:hypothetical protein
LKDATSLEPFTDDLKNNPKVHVQICQDDFLLSRQNIDWYGSTFGTNLMVYAHGGHLGNLHNPVVQEALISHFPPVPPPPPPVPKVKFQSPRAREQGG